MISPDIKRWLGNFGNLAAGEAVTGLLRFLALVAVARALGPESLGYLNVAVVAVGYALAFTHSGLDTLGMRDAARKGADPAAELQRLVALRLALAMIVYPVVVIGTFLISDDPLMRASLSILATSLFASAVDLRWLFIGTQRTRPVAAASIISSLFYLLAVLGFVRDPHDLLMAVAFQAGSELLLAATYAVSARARFGAWRPRLDRSFIRSALVNSFPVTALKTTRSFQLGFDVVFIKLFVGAAEAGVYGAARRLTNIGLILLALLWTAFMPGFVKASDSVTEARRLFRRALRFPVFIVIPIVMLASVAAPGLFPSIFGPGYTETAEAFQVLVWAFVPLSFGGLLSQVMIAHDQLRQLWAITTVAAIVNVAAVVFLYPALDLRGIAIGWIVAETAALIGGLYTLRTFLTGRDEMSGLQADVVTEGSILITDRGGRTEA